MGVEAVLALRIAVTLCLCCAAPCRAVLFPLTLCLLQAGEHASHH
jgi:hypothetical protein